MTHWLAQSPDGTTVDLFDFDFGANPHLRLEIYDQDEDDATPFDNRVRFWYLWLLFVKAPTTETESALAHKHDTPISGGWTVADLQRFWLAKGVWGAINSDGGGPAQLTYRQANGNYLLIPPRWAADNKREVVPPNFPNAPAGGSLMYFYVRDAK